MISRLSRHTSHGSWRQHALDSPSTDNLVLVIKPARRLHRLDHLLDAISRPRAQIERPILALLAHIRVDVLPLDSVERGDVSPSEIDDVQVITHAGPIDRGEIVAKDLEGVGDPAYGDGGEEGEEVVGLSLRVFTDLARGVGTAGARRVGGLANARGHSVWTDRLT